MVLGEPFYYSRAAHLSTLQVQQPGLFLQEVSLAVLNPLTCHSTSASPSTEGFHQHGLAFSSSFMWVCELSLCVRQGARASMWSAHVGLLGARGRWADAWLPQLCGDVRTGCEHSPQSSIVCVIYVPGAGGLQAMGQI